MQQSEALITDNINYENLMTKENPANFNDRKRGRNSNQHHNNFKILFLLDWGTKFNPKGFHLEDNNNELKKTAKSNPIQDVEW